MLLVSPSLGGAKTVGFGTGKPTTTVYGTDYADDHAIDPDADDVRHDLHPAWITLTSDEVIFHYPGIIGLRPGPVEVIERLPRDGVRLRWFHRTMKNLTSRVLHLEFADGTQLLTATAYQEPKKRRPFDDEADAFVEAFGDAAEHLS